MTSQANPQGPDRPWVILWGEACYGEFDSAGNLIAFVSAKSATGFPTRIAALWALGQNWPSYLPTPRIVQR